MNWACQLMSCDTSAVRWEPCSYYQDLLCLLPDLQVNVPALQVLKSSTKMRCHLWCN